MASDAQFHVNETARVASAAFERLMREGGLYALYLFYRPRQLAVFGDEGAPLGEGWELAFPERVPSNLDRQQLAQWFAARTGRIPYLT